MASGLDTTEDKFYFGFGVFMIAFLIASAGAWLTHVIWIIRKLASDAGATAGQMVLGVLGSFIPPVGAIHGFPIWFGWGM